MTSCYRKLPLEQWFLPPCFPRVHRCYHFPGADAVTHGASAHCGRGSRGNSSTSTSALAREMVAAPSIGGAKANKPHVIETGTRTFFLPVRSTMPDRVGLVSKRP